ncbi:FHA domain-containing protein [Planctomicrobium sp. SH661]|uniref:FHA domain-containing protein n=1 Tax=Planctomicrobium sp. SH661 TaxID=3448124 RepID=UPI003F5B3953
MPDLTFQVVEGLEAGRIFRNLTPPLTIGREEDNDVQLNDERISRFHAKVQEDSGRLILTDLESTNGTRVNGHPVRLRVLRNGDLIMVGRCVLLMGGPEELKKLKSRLRQFPRTDDSSFESATDSSGPILEASELNLAFPDGPPPVPSQLSPLQTAELADLLEYLRTELVNLISMPVEELRTSEGDFIRVQRDVWQGLESLAPELARMLNKLTNVDDVHHE